MSSLKMWLMLLGIPYLLGLFIYGIKLRKEARTLKQHFLADRKLPGWILSLTFFATLFSAFTVVGLPGFFYAHGVGTWLFVGFTNIVLVLSFFLVGHVFREKSIRYDTHSPVELIYRHYSGNYASKILSVVTLMVTCIFLIPYLAVQIAGVGRLLEGFEGLNIPFWLGASIMLIIIIVYSILAGMPGVIYTDILQATILFVALWVIAWHLVVNSPTWDGLDGLFKLLAEKGDYRLLTLPGPKGFYSKGMLVSLLIMILGVVVSQPQFVIRFFCSSGDKALRSAMIITAGLVYLIFIPVLIIGLAGSLLVPELRSADQITSKVLEIVAAGQPWFIALFIIAAFAAAMSTADSQLFVLGSMVARDIYRNLCNKDATPKDEKSITHIMIVALAMGSFLIAWKPPSFIVQLSIMSIGGTLQLVPTYLFMLFGPRISAWWAIGSIIMGLSVLTGWQYYVGSVLPWGIHPSIGGLLCGTVIMVIAYAVTSHSTTENTVDGG